MSCCIFLILMVLDFTPCNFAFLITDDLMDILFEGPFDVIAVVLCCFSVTGECLCLEEEEDATGTGSGRFRRASKLVGFSFSGEIMLSSVLGDKVWYSTYSSCCLCSSIMRFPSPSSSLPSEGWVITSTFRQSGVSGLCSET